MRVFSTMDVHRHVRQQAVESNKFVPDVQSALTLLMIYACVALHVNSRFDVCATVCFEIKHKAKLNTLPRVST